MQCKAVIRPGQKETREGGEEERGEKKKEGEKERLHCSTHKAGHGWSTLWLAQRRGALRQTSEDEFGGHAHEVNVGGPATTP